MTRRIALRLGLAASAFLLVASTVAPSIASASVNETPTPAAVAQTAPPTQSGDRSDAVVSGPVRFVPLGSTAMHEVGGGHYRGTLEVVSSSKTGLALIDELGFEDYLRGINEVPGNWPAEALKAQAVAARTYLLWGLAKGPAGEGKTLNYDICATTACQVYRGLDNEGGTTGRAWTDAVEATRGIAVTYGGKPILARYHSTSGGRTRNNEDVYTSEGPLPYLVAVDSPEETASPLWRWRSVFTKARMAEMLRADDATKPQGDLAGLEFTKYPDGSSKPNEVKITGASGTTVTRASTFARVVSREAAARWPADYPPPNPAKPGSKLPDAIPSSNFTFVDAGDSFAVEGSGWGHGVGMSQYGALGMAEAGRSYNQILSHYYADTKIERSGEPDQVRVGIGSGASKITIDGSGEFRVEGPDGKVLADRALGTFTVEPRAKGTVVVHFPPGINAHLALSGLSLATPVISPDAEALHLEYTISRPSMVHFVVVDAAGGGVYESDEKVVAAGAGQFDWALSTSSGVRAPPGEYKITVVARSGSESSELAERLAIVRATDAGRNGSRLWLVLAVVALVLIAITAAAAFALKKRRRRGYNLNIDGQSSVISERPPEP